MLDVQRIRADFPILQRTVNGKPLVYLDNAATSQKPRAVIEALKDYYERYNANVHRGVHTLSQEATDAFETVREQVARFIGARHSEEVVFVRNTTEAINLVSYAWARRVLQPGDEVIVTEMEHHSNLIPWQLAARDTGAVLRLVPLRDDGTLDLDRYAAILSDRTRLVAVSHMSNALGTINPVADMARLAHEQGALVLVDGAQSVPHLPVDVQALGCDFLAFSGHKMLGPTGVGVLWTRREVLESMDPFLGGGNMILQVWWDRAEWQEIPFRFEAGTPDIADVVAFGPALEYLSALGMDQVRAHELELTRYALARLREVEGLVIYGPQDAESRGGVFSFGLGDIHPHDIGTVLDAEGVAIRAGHHCCQPLMRRLGVPATARASFYLYNTPEEVDALVAALGKVQQIFGRARATV
ncbi:MAG: cysteine desulfurase [Chloroflexi bacterium]|jgi:cysteine desulfurase/selenocysteine lyase|nr:cysteine desulfurase [Chloroflexota bacterium]